MHSNTHHTLIPPDVRARLKTLRLASRLVSGAQGFGTHLSHSRGSGLEFAQYRAYEPGDELRQVDWKLYARSDRFFVREAERDSPLTAWVLMDGTASMGQVDGARPGWSRFDAARALAACTIELALQQGDRFGLAIATGDGLQLVDAGTGPRHRDRCLLALGDWTPRGRWPDETALRPLWERVGPQALMLVLSDWFDEGVTTLAERFASARREVLAIQLITVEERDFPFRGGHRFRDPETGEEILGDGIAVRDEFIARFAEARAALGRRLDASGIRHAAYMLDAPLDAPLRDLFGPHSAGTRA